MHSIPLLRISMGFVLAAIVLSLSACASESLKIWRQVPVQMARISQTESYKQRFLISTPDIEKKAGIEQDQALDQRMDNIFSELAGPKNWQHLKNMYGIVSVRNELLAGRIHMDGLINFNVYLDPTDLDYVVVEGSGRYFAIRDETDAILMSGDFHIPPQRYVIASLSSGCLPLDIKMYITRIPGKTTYYKDITVRYNLLIDTSNAETNAFSLDYTKDHYAFLDLDDNGKINGDRELIAALKLNGQYHQAKLFDIRGLSFIRDNYIISKEAELATAVSSKKSERECIEHDRSP